MNVVNRKKSYRSVLMQKAAVATALLALSLPAIDLGSQAAAADQSPLLEILIRKGILTREEAVQVQQEAAAQEQQQKQEIVKDIQDKGLAAPKALEGLKVEALGYVDYSAGKTGGAGDTQNSYNKMTLTRGYLTVQKEINSWLGARVTTDIYQEKDNTAGNNGDGSWNTRIKYLYAELKPDDLGFLTGMKVEVGQGHIPWLDFEENVNPYRCQGTMAIERAGVFNSADLGVSLRGDFGGKLTDAEALTGNSHYDGHYGSWHLGVYDGGGYHADETNGDKAVEGRLTLRPFPDTLPGLQLSYLGITGKANKADDAPDYTVNLGMISYEHPDFILTAQYFTTKGNSAGTWVYDTNEALDTAGTSFFGAYHLPMLDRKISLFGRYDHFDGDNNGDISDDAAYNLYMAGMSYDFYKGNMIVVDYEWTNYDNDSGGMTKLPVVGKNLGDDSRVQVVYQLKF